MKRLLTKMVLSLCLLVGLTLASYVPSAAAFDPFSNTCSASTSAGTSAVCSDVNSGNSNVNGTTDPVYHTIQTAANIIALIGGIAAVIVIMISGLNYITSGGQQEKIKNAKTRITGAIVGLVILALAYTITTFGVNLVK